MLGEIMVAFFMDNGICDRKLQTPKPHWYFREEKGFTSESAIGPGQSQVSQFGA